MEDLGANVLGATSGQEALTVMEDQRIDLILMDIQMPVLNGLEATKIIRRKYNATIPILALSAGSAVENYEGVWVKLINVETTEECVPYPFNDYMYDFGYFEVTGGVEIGGLFDHNFSGYWLNVAYDSGERTCSNTANRCEDSRESGQTFGSIEGIVNYSYNVVRVNPRWDADIDGMFAAEGTPEAACASSNDNGEAPTE